MIQRMKGIVGDWNRLLQEGSYLECTLVVVDVISEQRAAGGRGASASGLMSWRIGPASAARDGGDRTPPLSGNELHVFRRDPAPSHTPG